MTAEKIAIIGGASAYVPGILYSFTRSGEPLAGSEIALMDIDPSRLPTMASLGQRMVKESGANLLITSTTDLAEALDGTTFVLTNFRPGGIEGLRLDEQISDKHHMLGQETTGPGGTFFALRSVPQVLDLCAAMEKWCPEAWMISYVNPTNFVADAVRRKSRVKCLSICDGGGNGLRYSLPEMLGSEREDVVVRAAGVNHHSWLMQVRVAGEDAYPLLRRRLEETKAQEEESSQRYREFALWLLDRYGIYPANVSYLYPYFNYEDALAAFHAGHSVYQMFMRDLPYQWPRFEAMAKGEMPLSMDASRHHTRVGHGDLAVEMILSMATGKAREFHVNIPNEGAITNLPQGAIVEIPALVSRAGVNPLCMGDLPKGVVGLTRSLIAWQELTVDAALSGDRNLVVQALMAHPWPHSWEQVERLCDEMLSAHAAYLPQFQ